MGRAPFVYINHRGLHKTCFCDSIGSDRITGFKIRQAVSQLEHILGEALVIRQNGQLISDDTEVLLNSTLTVALKLCGGKGGFGSLLRSFGNQIHRTNNMEACRDLSGRRMRDVNNEKRLREWAAKQTVEKKEDEERIRKEKREKFLQGPKHEFNDPEFEKQSRAAVDNVHDAVEQGLKKSGDDPAGGSGLCKPPGLLKRKAAKLETRCIKKAKFWLGPGLDEEDLDSSDDDGDDARGVDDDDSSDSASQFSMSSSVYAMKGSDSEADLTTLSSDAHLPTVGSANNLLTSSAPPSPLSSSSSRHHTPHGDDGEPMVTGEVSDGGERKVEEGGKKCDGKSEEIGEVCDKIGEGEDEMSEGGKEMREGEDEMGEGGKEMREGEDEMGEGGKEMREGEDEMGEGGKEMREGEDEMGEGGKDIGEGSDEMSEGGDKVEAILPGGELDGSVRPLNINTSLNSTAVFVSSDGPRDVESIRTDSTAWSSPDSSLADSESVKSLESNSKSTAPASGGHDEGENKPLDLHRYTSVSELEELGLERLKVALTSLGLKCGGTLQQRAERLFSIRGVSLDRIDPSLKAKPPKQVRKTTT